jgi:hypothetical protein
VRLVVRTAGSRGCATVAVNLLTSLSWRERCNTLAALGYAQPIVVVCFLEKRVALVTEKRGGGSIAMDLAANLVRNWRTIVLASHDRCSLLVDRLVGGARGSSMTICCGLRFWARDAS